VMGEMTWGDMNGLADAGTGGLDAGEGDGFQRVLLKTGNEWVKKEEATGRD
jgi:hypothetical protein